MRELKHCIERMSALHSDGALQMADLPVRAAESSRLSDLERLSGAVALTDPAAGRLPRFRRAPESPVISLPESERQAIVAGAGRHQGERGKAAAPARHQPHHALSEDETIRDRVDRCRTHKSRWTPPTASARTLGRGSLFARDPARAWPRRIRKCASTSATGRTASCESRETALPPNVRRRLLAEPLGPRGADLFHGLNQRLPRIPLRRAVATFHDLFVMTGEYSTPEFRARFAEQARDAAARADAIIAVSEFTGSQVVSLLGVEPARVHVVHHGTRQSAGHRGRSAARR